MSISLNKNSLTRYGEDLLSIRRDIRDRQREITTKGTTNSLSIATIRNKLDQVALLLAYHPDRYSLFGRNLSTEVAALENSLAGLKIRAEIANSKEVTIAPTPPRLSVPPAPPVAQFTLFEYEPWEKETPSITTQEIIAAVDNAEKEWFISSFEENEKRLLAQAKKAKEGIKTAETDKAAELRTFHTKLFALVKKQTGVSTPRDFIWSLQQDHATQQTRPLRWSVIPVLSDQNENTVLRLEEGQFYVPDYPIDFDRVPVYKKDIDFDPWREATGQGFNFAVQRKGDHVYLYLDKPRAVYVNGALCSAEGFGKSKPCYCFKEGDILTFWQSFTFQVGKNGCLLFAKAKERNFLDRDFEAQQQSDHFAETVSRERSEYEKLQLTSKRQAAEIGLHEKLQPGFSMYCRPSTTDKIQDGDLLYVDFQKDRVLEDLAAYLKAEFSLVKYTSKQKMMRLAMLAADLLNAPLGAKSLQGNYLLGEVTRAGAGVCRHRALLIKALADKLDLPCGLVAGNWPMPLPYYNSEGEFRGFFGELESISGKGVAGHAWNIAEIDGKRYVVDAMHHSFFPIDNPPGGSSHERGRLLDRYGIKST